MKKSNFNIFFESNSKEDLVFNSLTCALAEIDNEFKYIHNNIESIKYDQLSVQQQELIEEMKKGGYIIEDTTDEMELVKFRSYKGKFSEDYLSLVIALTLSCNFACPYCYENPKSGIMEQKIQDKLVEMVKDAAQKKKDVDITWYGGEPMIAKKEMYNLSKKFIDICQENGVNYVASIITNGYLITKEDIEQMKASKIVSAQITVDGTAEVHNKRRILKGDFNQGTFEHIIENVKLLDSEDINISLRVNIDKSNIKNTEELIEFFAENNLKRLFINFGHVAPYNEKNDNIVSVCLDMEEYSSEVIRLQQLLYDKGFESSGFPYYPGIKANYCGADSISTYVIDAEGYKYKCWNEVGDVNQAVGNIMLSNDDVSESMIAREVSYIMWSPFKFEKCKACNLLPICMGGCPFSGRKLNDTKCERWKYNLIEVLKKTYDQKNAQYEVV